MLTAIIILTLLSIKDEIVGLVDLYSTLQGNLVVYFFNTFITISLALIEMRFISVYEGSWTEYLLIVLGVSILASFAGVYIVKNKKVLKNLLRKKRIAKGMKKHWENRKNIGGSDAKENTDKTDEGNEIHGTDKKDTLYGDVPVQELWNTPYRPGDKSR